jgi:hypothetical protein
MVDDAVARDAGQVGISLSFSPLALALTHTRAPSCGGRSHTPILISRDMDGEERARKRGRVGVREG